MVPSVSCGQWPWLRERSLLRKVRGLGLCSSRSGIARRLVEESVTFSRAHASESRRRLSWALSRRAWLRVLRVLCGSESAVLSIAAASVWAEESSHWPGAELFAPEESQRLESRQQSALAAASRQPAHLSAPVSCRLESCPEALSSAECDDRSGPASIAMNGR